MSVYISTTYLDCSHFDMEKTDKGPKEIFSPEVQRELLVLEEQEVRCAQARPSATTDTNIDDRAWLSRDILETQLVIIEKNILILPPMIFSRRLQIVLRPTSPHPLICWDPMPVFRVGKARS